MAFFNALSLSQGSSFRYLMQVSNVAPPQVSREKNPTWSIFSAMGSISLVLILVARRD
ncbi:MAG: hypothetical protein BWY13_01346 [Euryarchaeota archaeon ADurb.Bin190]|nr:MAG: hypothetical protein BWY13_01346 [Euryarchaeota archaeon ADurb.Bin190]